MYTADRHRINDCKIGIKDFSDHSGVYFTMHLDNKKLILVKIKYGDSTKSIE